MMKISTIQIAQQTRQTEQNTVYQQYAHNFRKNKYAIYTDGEQRCRHHTSIEPKKWQQRCEHGNTTGSGWKK